MLDEMLHKPSYKMRHGLLYPVNVARNIAWRNAQTYFVFPADIEMIPSRGLVEQFLGNLSTSHNQSLVYVILSSYGQESSF